MTSKRLSVVIITYNEENNIGRCINSVKEIADEIIVLDSLSTDRTVEIAKEGGALVTQLPFQGHIEQKNFALTLASHNYVLSLDADEALNKTLLAAILQEKNNNFPYRAYIMNRCACYCGKFIHHGLWYPDRKLRLFDKSIAYWDGINPHDKIALKEKSDVKQLKGDLLHYSYNTIEEHILQCNKYSSISADSLYRLGKKSTLFKIILNPSWAFFNGYILHLGILDGFYGLVIAINYSHQTFQKYAKLYQLQRKNK